MVGAEWLNLVIDVGAAVWRASWQASVLAALVLAVQLIVGNRIAARWRHAMWMLVLVRLALPVVPSSPVSVFNLAPAVTERAARTGMTPIAGGEPLAPLALDELTRVATSRTGPPSSAKAQLDPARRNQAAEPRAAAPLTVPDALPAGVSPRDLRMGWTQILATLWVLGVALLSLRIAWATWRLSRTLRGLDPIEDAVVRGVLRATADELCVRRLPKLLAGDGLFSPALVGFVRPKLLVPRALLTDFDPAELRLVFLHELAHLKRRDVAINWAATVLTVLHWPNPVAWLAAWRLRIERELACDELVMSAAASDADRRAYGHTIVKLLEALSRGPSAAPARPLPAGGVGILEGKAQMKRRIVMIAHFARSSRAWTAVAVTIVLVLGLVALTDAVQAEAPAKPSLPAATQPTSRQVKAHDVPGREDVVPDEIRKLMERATPPSADEVRAAVEAGVKDAVDRLAQRDFRGRVINQSELDQLARTEADRLTALLRSKVHGAPQSDKPSPTDAEIAQSDPTMRTYVQQLADLESQRALMGRSVGEKHPSVAALDEQIKAARQFVASYGEQRRKQMRQPTKLKGGDLVAVSIMDLVGQGIETVKTARIDGDGTINLPYVGEVKATGLSPRELERAVAKAFDDKGVIQNAVVLVSMPERGESHQMVRRPASFAEPSVPGAVVAPATGMEDAMMGDPEMMGMASPVAPVDEAAKALLGRKLPEVKFDNVPFNDVVDFLREATSTNLFVNWRALEAAGIDRAAPVTMQLREVALKDVLALLVRDVGLGTIAYRVENGVVVIDAPQPPARLPKVTIKTYDVLHLLGGGTEDQLKPKVVDLQRVIVSTVRPTTWQTGTSAVSAFDLRLIVSASDEVHADIEQLLKMLERGDGATTKPAAAPKTH